ncbi:MAG: hypothetical protein J6W82_06980 [Bacteroidales bacterium]|jgi:hypothetical protein|nr:hypothetical protein [Bacteroidales bacterium]
MRNCVLTLMSAIAALLAVSCSQGASGGSHEAPELLRAVPSDALCAGVFSRCDRALDHMTDSNSVLRQLDYGRLSRSRAVVALCDVGTVQPLLVLEAGKHGSDTLEAATSLMALADSSRLYSALVELPAHNAVVISPSSTVLTIVRRHLASESSVLDAPGFEAVPPVLGSSDGVFWRNREAAKLFDMKLGSVPRKALLSFLRDATEWTVAVGEKLYPIQTPAERYYCNFMSSLGDGTSRLGSFRPAGAELVIDIPVASLQEWRGGYETWLDARVELEQYQKRLQSLRKATGKDPLSWEKEAGVKEVAYVTGPGYCVNMVRTGSKLSGDGVQKNPYTGFVNALYGAPFNAADSCMIHCGNWIVSGERAVLDTLSFDTVKTWPAKARAVVSTPERRLVWTKENIRIWNSVQ